MCEQTEINYLDGDIVWVKLGACWWPGQVTGFHNLPEDIQEEFQKKPLIAAVKFFQEDTYEFVKNYQQIYKYNCTLKDDFIKKGLDKYRSKSKDGSRYMDKFPGDVEMAEKLTGGDPDILNSDKFSPEEKPNISALFGDKKVPKRKREREEFSRRSDGIEIARKITHPRFLKESDHEVRIRQQPSSLPSTPNNSSSPQYPCHLCDFTASRVNVIICHIRSHKFEDSFTPKSKVKTYSQYKSRYSDEDTPKRKYAKKEKGQSTKSKSNSESTKRKQSKQGEKAAKKKKTTDPKIRDTILADWEDESDEEISLTPNKSSDLTFAIDSSINSQFDGSKSEESNEKDNALPDPHEIIAETEKLLKETEKLTAMDVTEESINRTATDFKSTFDKSLESEKVDKTSDVETASSKKTEKDKTENDNKLNTLVKDDKKSLLSCFDFHEEEPSIPPVRKKARAFNQKKEIIKEFEMSQALKTEQEKESENEESNINSREGEKSETQTSRDQDKAEESNTVVDKNKETIDDTEVLEKKMESEEVTEDKEKSESEIAEVLKDKSDGKVVSDPKPMEVEAVEEKITKESLKNEESNSQDKSIDGEKTESKDTIAVQKDLEPMEQEPTKETEQTTSERFTVETEDETVSESADTLPEQSENSDADMLDQDQVPNSDATNVSLNNEPLNITLQVRRRRGRPRKSDSIRTNSSGNTSGNESPRIKDMKNSAETSEIERTSESDSERSYSGRKRKPNKKYLESDIYVQDVDKIYKTDESQSENEDKGYKKVKVKSKRGRKSIQVDKKINEQVDFIQEKELEISCNIVDNAGNNVDSSIIELKNDFIEDDTSKNQVPMDPDTKQMEIVTAPESSEKSQPSSEEKESTSHILLENVEIKETENSATKDDGATLEPKEIKDSKMEVESIELQSTPHKEDTKDSSTESSNACQLDILLEKEAPQQSDSPKTIDMLPPKKSQIKKFELSQIDFFDTDNSVNKVPITVPESDKEEKIEDSTDKTVETIIDSIATNSSDQKGDPFSEEHETDVKDEGTVNDTSKVEEKKTQENEKHAAVSQEVYQMETEIIVTEEQESDVGNLDQTIKELTPTLNEQQPQDKTSVHSKCKTKSSPETKSKKNKEPIPEGKTTNTFQEAFLKTLHMDKKKGITEGSDATGKWKKGKKLAKKIPEEETDTTSSDKSTKVEVSNLPETTSNFSSHDNSQVTVMGNLEGIEVVVDQSLDIGTKVEETVFQNVDKFSSNEFNVMPKSLMPSTSGENDSKPLSLDMQKLDESSRVLTSTPSPSADVSVPVKKREMPRIIETVTLTEPMQILKSKLLDKTSQKPVKHKLESESPKKGEQKGSPKTKIIKLDPLNTKVKSGSKVTNPHLTLTKKLQVLKAEEAETAAMIEAQNEQLNVKSSSTTTGEKYIQQSSQSLADMELDISSMPFVLSEDVLTPESIEQMPVVISSIIPASSTISATLPFTPTTQMVTPTQSQFKLNENTGETTSPTKKKSGPPAILKNKSKAKPTITSIKTLVPPLTGGVKGIKFQNTPATSKVSPFIAQKGTPGKYVVVQTSGGQQIRYSVQGKSGTQQKVAIPTGKTTGNAQVVQQGGKVVILTSTQSSQAKMVPLNISKTLGGKVQRIVTNKGQVLCPVNSQGIIGPKTIIAPKGDGVSPTTSKLPVAPKIINSPSIITSKGVLTPISGTIAKTALLGTLSQGIFTKGGIYTPISTSTLGGKTIIGSKALVTKGTQGIVSNKGTVLTPITGQQVKAIAAKSPTKGTKVQYQSIAQKVQLPMLQKSQKIQMPPAQGRSGQMKTGGGAVVLQNTVPTQKTITTGRKLIKQTVVQQGSGIQSVQQAAAMSPQKGKTVPASTMQKVIIPRGNRQTKVQQKIVVQKVQEPTISTAQNLQLKQTTSSIPLTKTTMQQKQAANNAAKGSTKGHVIKGTQMQKNVMNTAMNSVTTSNVSTNLSTTLSLPPLEPIDSERKSNVLIETIQKEQTKVDKFNIEKGSESEKVEEPKIPLQPQIMALPTESSDGTQTYVLVTIDEQGQIQPLDNNTLMSLEGTLDNIVLQFDNGVMPNIQTSVTDASQTIISESFPTSEVIQTSNQDILAAALANTDFQQEISLAENPAVMTTGLTQTSLINQTILQSTIIPPTEPISSASVLETTVTMNQPIMTPLEVPSNLPIQSETTPTSEVSTIPSSLELPITITNPNISYISTGEAQIQIPGNSMPDIGEIIENPNTAEIAQIEIPASTQYLVLPNLEDNIAVETQTVQSNAISMPSVSYSVSIPNNMVLQTSQVQTTPSMPIIDDTYTENVQFTSTMEPSISTGSNFVGVPVSEMLVSKSATTSENVKVEDIAMTSAMTVSQDVPGSSQETIVSTNESPILNEEQGTSIPLQEVFSSQENPVKSEDLKDTVAKEKKDSSAKTDDRIKEVDNNDNAVDMEIVEQSDDSMSTTMPIMDESTLITSESSVKMSPVEHPQPDVSDSNEINTNTSQESKTIKKFEELNFDEQSSSKVHSPIADEQAATSNEVEVTREVAQSLPAESLNQLDEQSMDIDEPLESKVYAASSMKESEDCQRDEPSSQGEAELVERNLELHFEETNAETSHETPSQSYEQFGMAVTTDSIDMPSQSATKSENSREPSQSISYEPMETDEETVVTEPPTQSFEHSKANEASQSYETSIEENTNAPTQSFNELMQSQEERTTVDESIDDQTFPTQSYEVDKPTNVQENLETDAEISQEGNMPSQSNDIGTDGIGTSSVSTNNSGLNEDETASSSYVPETPENQERDPDQESAISTSSCEIPPCAELNIASSSAEHTSIHDNGVPEIPTSSYNLNPDITSTHVDSVPTSSYEEQNVSTSYEVPISMPGLEETPSQNFVTESTDHRNEPSSYTHHQEVTASYYDSVGQETNSRLDEDPQEEITPSYYDSNPQEASQSYFTPEEATPSYSSHNVSPSYYDHRPETEASQSYYSAEDMEKTDQSSSQNIEASQSFYQEQSDELKLTQQGEATPTYTERYPVDYTLENSPMERHDLVESSVPATRPTER